YPSSFGMAQSRFAFSPLLILVPNPHPAAIRIRGTLGRLVRMLVDLVEHQLDRGVELRVFAIDHLGRIIGPVDVRIDAVPFNAPRAVWLVERKCRNGDAAAVDQSGISRDADQTAPGAFADQLS